MAEAVLLIDRGNTRLKWLWALDGEIDTKSARHGDFDAFRQAAAESPRASAVRISSVAGLADTRALQAFCAERWGVEAELMAARAEQGGVRNAYANPAELGVDRWLAIVGAVGRYGKPMVVWDLGTAATLDAVDAEGQHLGGMILPGPATMLAALGRHTELPVPRGPGAADERAATIQPGDNTADCIRHGVLAAQSGALTQFLHAVSGQLGSRPKLIITGGAAPYLLPYIEREHLHDPWLVFRGMLLP